MKFEFATATRIIFGPGALQDIGALAGEFGKRALVATGKDLSRAGKLLALLRQAGVSATTFSVAGEPEISTVYNGVAHGRKENCDFVIGFGGGSALDAAKAIAAMLANDGDLLDYLEIIGRGKPLNKPSAPLIAIPTTAGTGAEVTRNAVLASPEHGLKVSLRSPLMLAKIALVDPELTYDLPPAITARTGMDALTQLIEPLVCSRANAMTDSLCVEGISRVARSLRTAFHDGQNKSVREDMALASLFGGLALANAGLGAVHGFAGPIGGIFPNAPHGAICAILLPHVMATNIRALHQRDPHNRALKEYDQIARICTGDKHATTDTGVDWVRTLIDELQIPRLGTYGIKSEQVDELVRKASQASSMKANPIALTPEELAETLRRAF
ncbi:MAG TPA: iron-containing alcohol dehydrogenase [Verrucomicrobiae bacterium]|jgi:alcohol dehydrogenase class IV|nr:iron-containing alcohol dehydrogenase [Verrucomicrobiae bacterium]